MQVDEIAEPGLLGRDLLPVGVRALDQAFGREAPGAILIDPERQAQMVLVMDERGERDRELARAHVGLEILAGQEDAHELARSDPRHGRMVARIGVGDELLREDGIEDDLRLLREHEVVFVEDEGEKSAEMIGVEPRPERREVHAYAGFHAPSPASAYAASARRESWPSSALAPSRRDSGVGQSRMTTSV